jgi:hypothetical protein
MNAEKFDDWSEAYDVCRERNHPIVAQVGGEICKIFPSGSAQQIAPRLQTPAFITDFDDAEAK